jgi:hypothetical protein
MRIRFDITVRVILAKSMDWRFCYHQRVYLIVLNHFSNINPYFYLLLMHMFFILNLHLRLIVNA